MDFVHLFSEQLVLGSAEFSSCSGLGEAGALMN